MLRSQAVHSDTRVVDELKGAGAEGLALFLYPQSNSTKRVAIGTAERP